MIPTYSGTYSPTATYICTCNQTTPEPCRATWHVRQEPGEPKPSNRHERRKRAAIKRRA